MKILQRNNSAFFRWSNAMRSKNLINLRFPCGNVDFAAFSIAPYVSRTWTYKYRFAARRNNERESAGEAELRGKQKGEKNMSRVGRARTRRPVTYGTFCPNSARTYFHAARASHALSRAPINQRWRTADPSRADDSLFFFLSFSFYFKRKLHGTKARSIECLIWSFTESMSLLLIFDYFIN